MIKIHLPHGITKNIVDSYPSYWNIVENIDPYSHLANKRY